MNHKTILFHKTSTKNVKLKTKKKRIGNILRGLNTNPKTMGDERGKWLGAMVSSSVKGAVQIPLNEAALLLDRRLAWTKGARIMSFVAGMAATFLQKEFLPDCEVLRGVSEETLEQLDDLLFNALPDFRARAAAANLLFRSTRDGATAASFHSHCDFKGPTLTLIKDTDGNVFGGYTSTSWESGRGNGLRYITDAAAFLVSITNPRGSLPAIFPFTADKRGSVVHGTFLGPMFHGGFHIGAFSSSNVTHYKLPAGVHPTEALTGKKEFVAAILEVYAV